MTNQNQMTEATENANTDNTEMTTAEEARADRFTDTPAMGARVVEHAATFTDD